MDVMKKILIKFAWLYKISKEQQKKIKEYFKTDVQIKKTIKRYKSIFDVKK